MNRLILAFKTLINYRLYTIINILGLAMSLACVIFISRYIYRESTVDRFHSKIDRIVIPYSQSKDNSNGFPIFSQSSKNTPSFIPFINDAAIEKYTKYTAFEQKPILLNNKNFTVNILAVDTNFLQILDFTLATGNDATLFATPDAAVISQQTAKRLFPAEDPIGKVIIYDNMTFVIKGVLEEVPLKSSLNFDVLISLSSMRDKSTHQRGFILLKPNSSIEDFNQRYSQYYQDFDGYKRNQFAPLNDFYNNPSYQESFCKQIFLFGNPKNTLLLTFIAAIMLIVGLFNFINTYTVLTLKRSRELSIKKIFGSSTSWILIQLIIENFVMITIAIITGWLVTLTCENLIMAQLGIDAKGYLPFDILLSLAMVVVLPLLTSVMPYFKYKYSKPITSLKTVNCKNKAPISRSLFLTAQYIMTFAMVVVSLYFIHQLKFMLDTEPGYQTKDVIQTNMLSVDWSKTYQMNNEQVQQYMENINQQRRVLGAKLNVNPDIIYWSFGRSPLSLKLEEAWLSFQGKDRSTHKVICNYVSQYYKDIFGLQVVQGRWWSDSLDSWNENKCIVTQSTIKMLGITDIEKQTITPTKKIRYVGDPNYIPSYQIIGVVRDFNSEHLSKPIPPIVFMLSPDRGNNADPLLIRVLNGKTKQVIEYLNQIHQYFQIESDFECSMVEHDKEMLYAEDKKVATIYSIFTTIAVLISSLGLFSMSFYDAQQRYREIAIRRVNGATVWKIVKMLLSKYCIILGISFLIATPLALMIIDFHMQEFTLKAPMSLWIFVVAIIITTLVSLLTLVYQIINASSTNPVEAIKAQ